MKKTVLFGAGQGHVVDENLASKPEFIVDNNPDMQGTEYCGLEVKSPLTLDGMSKEYDVIVCTTSVSEVKKQLVSYGYTWGENAKIAVILNEKSVIADLEDEKFNFLISCGLPSTATSFSGGGIHLVKENGDYPDIETIYKGDTHGMVSTENGGYAFTCQGQGIVCLDSDLNVINTIPMPIQRKGLRPHGLKRYKNVWVVACSLGDCILGINDDAQEIFCYKFSNKIESYESAQHHCNDLEIIGDFAYTSMFSVTGNWKRGVFDGGIIEVNLLSGDTKVINNNFTMPHSVTRVEDGLFILDSFKGKVLGGNFKEIAQLPGFVRGFDSNETYYFIGESKNRNFSRLSTGRAPVSIDSRITIINKKYEFCRSIPLPSRISEIHSIIHKR